MRLGKNGVNFPLKSRYEEGNLTLAGIEAGLQDGDPFATLADSADNGAGSTLGLPAVKLALNSGGRQRGGAVLPLRPRARRATLKDRACLDMCLPAELPFRA